MRLVLVGVPGSGKSTIIKEIKKTLDIPVIDAGSFVLEASKKYGVKTRDEIRSKLSPEQFRKVQEEAASKVSKIKGDMIIDTHLTIKTPVGYFPGLPDNVVKKLKPDIFVLLEFDPSDILGRREADSTRKRDVESIRLIEMQQNFNRYFAASSASACNAYIKVVDLREKQKKPFEHVKAAADEVIKALSYNK